METSTNGTGMIAGTLNTDKTATKPIVIAVVAVLIAVGLMIHPLVASWTGMQNAPLRLGGWLYAGQLAVATVYYLGIPLALSVNRVARKHGRAFLSEDAASGLMFALWAPVFAMVPGALIGCLLLLPF
jgi:hypothetical protein